jgi:3-dehydroquinate synthase
MRSPDAAVTHVPVDLAGRSYDIAIGRGLLQELGPRLRELRPGAAAAVVTDEHVAGHHLDAALASLDAAGVRHANVTVPAGEASKCFTRLEEVCDGVIAARIERRDVVVALGGGVVGDLAGFAAASVRRGLDFVQVPTTLLAQVDSSVGGKTGINTPRGKNLVGAFHQPILVLADTALLDTLPAREFRAGYAEVAKYGLIDDAAFFGWLEQNAPEIFSGGPAREQAIAISCRSKAAIVARDEFETGDRQLLNLGHTFGHALEAGAGFSARLLHGEAVAIGMVLAFAFSARLGHLDADEVARVRRHLAALGLPTEVGQIPGGTPGVDGLMDLIAQDKKVKRGKLTFILARGIGQSFIAPDVDPAAVRAFLADVLAPGNVPPERR